MIPNNCSSIHGGTVPWFRLDAKDVFALVAGAIDLGAASDSPKKGGDRKGTIWEILHLGILCGNIYIYIISMVSPIWEIL